MYHGGSNIVNDGQKKLVENYRTEIYYKSSLNHFE
jgi:hypothetical protein